jgi:polyphosphate kinase 2
VERGRHDPGRNPTAALASPRRSNARSAPARSPAAAADGEVAGYRRSAHRAIGVGPDGYGKRGSTTRDWPRPPVAQAERPKLKRKSFEKNLTRLQRELVVLQEYIKAKGLKVVVVFEGRDAAGKGGVIKRIAERTSSRAWRIAALTTPTERESSQWYFQRYVAHLPAAGELVMFDRSWYNRAGVERVMGFCTDDEYREFLRSCPEFERMLVRSGIILVKYWFSVSDTEQERRFQKRVEDPMKRWKLSPMDLKSRELWVEYSRAKDDMFAATDIEQAPWYVIDADDKRRARLNCISHLLSLIPYQDVLPPPLELPERQPDQDYERPPLTDYRFVPEVY